MSAPQVLTVKVERMAPEGEAIARAENSPKIVFVPHGVPGDRLEVELASEKSTFARGRIRKLLTAGPERISPPCALHFNASHPGPACGGCDWQQLGYESQLKYKRDIVLDCLRRIGKFQDAAVAEVIAAPYSWEYRNKVQIPFGLDAGSKRIVAGFYETGSHRIVDFEACPVQPELSVRIARKVKELARRFGWTVYGEKSGRGWLRHLFVRTNDEGKALVALVTHSADFPRREEFAGEMRRAFPEIVSLYQNVQTLKTSVILGPSWRNLWGAKAIEEKIGDFTFLVSPGAFLQVNTPAAAILYDQAAAALKAAGRTFPLVLDLYSGAGTLSLWLAKSAAKVVGIEENREAVRDAWKNAEKNGVKNVRFSAGKVEAVLPRLKHELPEPCAGVVDPPRAGLSVPVLRFLTAPKIKRVVYVSCNPATFARDAGYLCHSGFKLKRVQPVDLFPQTSHVELVGLLDRS